MGPQPSPTPKYIGVNLILTQTKPQWDSQPNPNPKYMGFNLILTRSKPQWDPNPVLTLNT